MVPSCKTCTGCGLINHGTHEDPKWEMCTDCSGSGDAPCETGNEGSDGK